jgi:hypothetical protein
MEWPIFASKPVRIVTDFWSFSFANFSRQATNLFRRFSMTFRSDCETSQNEYNIYSILNVWVTSLFQPPYCFYPRVTAMLPWKHTQFQDGVMKHWSILSKFQVYFLPIVHTSEQGLCISWTRKLICIVLWWNFLAPRHVQQTWKIEQTCDGLIHFCTINNGAGK